uniref:Ketosynthase n=1 Tax=Streptoalloteichus sp. ATCC 53650 TaxID=756733 RepID=K4P104_9PSEU|nr:ketosynthase [Streptoalloteichus sp. ATCC 53650]
MTAMVITGWSAVTAAGIGADALARRVADPASAGRGVVVDGLSDVPLPAPTGHALPGFDVRAELGRKGTSWYDRTTALAVVCCRDALRSAGAPVEGDDTARIGVALGTTLGSHKSVSDYTRETLVQERPYWVNPALFPTTVMNCAAGQVAIRLGLRGVNATLAGGPLAFLNALRYAATVIGRGYADVMLTGAAEEYAPHRAWAAHHTGTTANVPLGEAAAVFVLAAEREGVTGPRVLAVATGYAPGGGAAAGQALEGCVARVLRRADVDPAGVSAVFTGEADSRDTREFDAVARVLGHAPERVLAKQMFGECDAASGAVALAVALSRADTGRVLLTAVGADGAVGAALVEGSA